MAWNATIGVNERYRRLRYVVNGPSLAPSRARIHLSISYTLHVPIYTHNIELPTFTSYQSKDWQRTIENTNDETSLRSQTKLDNSLLYDRSQRNRESSRCWWPPWRLYIPEFYYQIVSPTKSHSHENIVPGGMHSGCVLIKKTQNLHASSRIGGTLVFLASTEQQ